MAGGDLDCACWLPGSKSSRLDRMSESAPIPLLKSGGWLLLRMVVIAVLAVAAITLIRYVT